MGSGLRDFLLDEARRRGTWVLAGNREYWAKLTFEPEAGFVHLGGDSMTGETQFRTCLNEEDVFLLLRNYCLDRVATWGREDQDAWLLDWIRLHPALV
jgi:hypothetical protein